MKVIDQQECLDIILKLIINAETKDGRNVNRSIYELCLIACNHKHDDDQVNPNDAKMSLARYGINFARSDEQGDNIFFIKSPELNRLLESRDFKKWSNDKYMETLKRHPRASDHRTSTERGIKVSVPLKKIYQETLAMLAK